MYYTEEMKNDNNLFKIAINCQLPRPISKNNPEKSIHNVAKPESMQISNMESFATIVNGF